MDRRTFLQATAGATLCSARAALADEDSHPQTMTVMGPVAPGQLGLTLPHEHVLVDFIGADKVSRERYDRDEAFEVALPHLQAAKQAGCQTLVECTPAYLARDPVLLRRLAKASKLHILTNTGYYGAAGGKYLPGHARHESADQLAQRWLQEWREGIEDTGVRPGFIKIGVDQAPLSEVNRKLVRAAARTHRESGLTIACHTGDGAAAMEELAILREEGVAPAAWIWVHAQNERDQTLHVRAAEQGGWVEFDGIAPNTIERHVELVQNTKRHGLLGRVLLSHDAGWYSVGETGGGKFRPYTTLFEQFLPALKKAGFTDDELQQPTVVNPAEAFTVQVRRLS
jgi:phosphotriesterase-related protein